MSSPDRNEPKGSAADAVHAALRRDIVMGAHEPGDVLSRPALARRFGVSQTPVREAMDRLAGEGFVTVRPRSGTVVAPVDVTALFEGHYLSVALLTEAARLLAGRKAAGAARSALDDPGEFRKALLADVGMARLWEGLGAYFGALERCRALDPAGPAEPRALREDVLGRIEAGDARGAVSAVRALLSDDLAPLPGWRSGYPAMFA